MQNITTNTPGFENIVNGAQEIRKIEKKLYNTADQLPTAARDRILDALADYEYDTLAALVPQVADLAHQLQTADNQVRAGIDLMSTVTGIVTAEQFASNTRLFMDSTQ